MFRRVRWLSLLALALLACGEAPSSFEEDPGWLVYARRTRAASSAWELVGIRLGSHEEITLGAYPEPPAVEWSPDRRALAIGSIERGTRVLDVLVLSADGVEGETRLTRRLAAGPLQWTADGRFLIFVKHNFAGGESWRVYDRASEDGTDAPLSFEGTPMLAPRGSAVAGRCPGPPEVSALCVAPSPEDEPRRVPQPPGHDSMSWLDPDRGGGTPWSPDGRWLVYASAGPGLASELFLTDTEATELHRLGSAHHEARSPSFAIGTRAVTFFDQDRAFLLRLTDQGEPAAPPELIPPWVREGDWLSDDRVMLWELTTNGPARLDLDAGSEAAHRHPADCVTTPSTFGHHPPSMLAAYACLGTDRSTLFRWDPVADEPAALGPIGGHIGADPRGWSPRGDRFVFTSPRRDLGGHAHVMDRSTELRRIRQPVRAWPEPTVTQTGPDPWAARGEAVYLSLEGGGLALWYAERDKLSVLVEPDGTYELREYGFGPWPRRL